MRFSIFLLVFSFLHSFSQNNVQLFSGDGTLFKIILKDKPVNTNEQSSVVLHHILEDTLPLKVELAGRRFGITLFLLQKGLQTKNKEFVYRLDSLKNSVKVVFMGINELVSPPAILVPDKPVADTSLKYKNSLMGHFCEMKDGKPMYFNNIPKEGNCEIPMPEEYQGYIKILIAKAQVPDEKFRICENVVRNNCISTLQLSKMLTHIDFEIEKLKLVRIARPQITDLNSAKDLEKSFRFESSINELRKIFSAADQSGISRRNSCLEASPEKDVLVIVDRLKVVNNDSQKFEILKKVYGDHCFSTSQTISILSLFIHDREKLEAAKMLYYNSADKKNYAKISEVFSYNVTIGELQDFLSKQ